MAIKKTSAFLIVLLTVTTAWADSYPNDEKSTNFIVTPSIAYRYDVFKWSVPDDVFPQKKLSELVWKNHIIQPGIKIEIKPTLNQFTFLGQAKYGHILKNPSKPQDLDWLHSTTEPLLYSKTKSAVKGNILDLSGTVGYSVNLFNNNLLTFYVGYDYSDYRNKNYGSLQLLNYRGMPYPSNQMVQKYYFKTQSPWFGLSVNAPLNKKFTITPTIKFYSFKYVGKGYWLCRDDLKQNPSMKHNAKGTGLGFDMDFLYKYNDNLDFKINLETKKFKMKTGKDQAFYNYLAFGGERIVNRKLLDLSLISSSITAGFSCKL